MKCDFIKQNRGFSLIELIAVMAIIAVLTGVLLPNYMGARERAKDAQKIQELSTIKNALRLYYNDKQAYPTGTGSTLGAGFSTYLPQISSIGHTYYQVNNGDGFQLCVGVEAMASGADTESQVKCGIGSSNVCNLAVGVTARGVYSVCAN